ncbi:PRC-barrel domain-containing protein [Streptosporangium sp. KLBMP 9127]|nr:PRC-barrel domain-containing protein [Streptosporangium sp. KLBMP 9127]
MTPQLWTYRADVHDTGKNLDVVGYDVEATDGKIGSVDDATYDVGQSYLIVDTGPWIFGKKVMLPASTVTQIDPQERKIYVARTKHEIKSAPEFDASAFKETAYRDRLGEYYGRFPHI